VKRAILISLVLVLVLQLSAQPQTTPSNADSKGGSSSKTAPCPGKVEAPRPVVTPDPQRPNNSPPGVVVISCVIGTDGRVHDPKLARSLNREADASALAAIEKWEFKPATCDGSPFATKMKVEVAVR
jgi:TonB family protein